MSAVRPDPTILLLGAVLPIVCVAFLILLLKVKGLLFFDLGRSQGGRPRLLVAPMLILLALAMGSNAFFHRQTLESGAWVVLGVAVIGLALTKSSREAKAAFEQRIQADLAKKETSR